VLLRRTDPSAEAKQWDGVTAVECDGRTADRKRWILRHAEQVEGPMRRWDLEGCMARGVPRRRCCCGAGWHECDSERMMGL